jgi:hypothetical protein
MREEFVNDKDKIVRELVYVVGIENKKETGA